MNELAEERRRHPPHDPTPKLATKDVGEDMLRPEEIGPFFILLAVAGNDTTRTAISHGMDLLAVTPDQRKIWQDDVEPARPPAGEESVRVAAPVTFMRRTLTRDLELSGHQFQQDD